MASTRPVMTAGGPEQIGQLMVGMMKQNLAAFGQYLVPFLCLLGAGVSIFRRQQRAQLINNVTKGTGSRALKDIGWQEFEQLVGEVFRRRGYTVQENGGGGADGGIDLVLRKNGERFVVQCKQWRAAKVGVTVIRELYGVMMASGAVGGFVVTCGAFTEEARAFAHGCGVLLLDGEALEKMIRQTSPGLTTPSGVASASVHPATASPACPVCRRSMLSRTAQRGANAGKKFWGCSAFPSCRGIRAVH